RIIAEAVGEWHCFYSSILLKLSSESIFHLPFDLGFRYAANQRSVSSLRDVTSQILGHKVEGMEVCHPITSPGLVVYTGTSLHCNIRLHGLQEFVGLNFLSPSLLDFTPRSKMCFCYIMSSGWYYFQVVAPLLSAVISLAPSGTLWYKDTNPCFSVDVASSLSNFNLPACKLAIRTEDGFLGLAHSLAIAKYHSKTNHQRTVKLTATHSPSPSRCVSREFFVFSIVLASQSIQLLVVMAAAPGYMRLRCHTLCADDPLSFRVLEKCHRCVDDCACYDLGFRHGYLSGSSLHYNISEAPGGAYGRFLLIGFIIYLPSYWRRLYSLQVCFEFCNLGVLCPSVPPGDVGGRAAIFVFLSFSLKIVDVRVVRGSTIHFYLINLCDKLMSNEDYYSWSSPESQGHR
ncbi:hypothetical protein KSS87_006985, partial [Heliosperma pusillum]